ncbi:MAG: DUF1385 domain-containing protein [Candidatus Peregrinibacteria bacterium]
MQLIKIIHLQILNLLTAELDENSDKKIDFAVGGQAVIEGVMMRSPNHITVAVRKKSGKIILDKKPYKSLTQRKKYLNIPIIRGVINLFEMMAVGAKAINYSANESVEEEPVKKEDKTSGMKIFETVTFILSFIIAIAFSIFLFKFVPLWTTTLLENGSGYIQQHYIVFNLIDGALKISIFLLYIFLLSLIPSFKRVFQYHGAEHKSIFTYENKQPLDTEHAAPQSRFHPRCGTSFILIVFVISIIVYTFVPKQENFWINLSLRLAFLPVIAGISYEYLKISAKHAGNNFVGALIAPGLWFQRLTTKEPDSSQLEVGLASLKEALVMEKESSKSST